MHIWHNSCRVVSFQNIFYHLYNFDVVFLEDLPLPRKNSWINFPMTSPGIMGQRYPGRLRPPVDARCTMHVTEKQQLSLSGDRSLLCRVWGQYQQREKTTCPLNVSPCCLSLAVNMQRLICTGHCVVIMNSSTQESELLFLNVSLSQFECRNNNRLYLFANMMFLMVPHMAAIHILTQSLRFI